MCRLATSSSRPFASISRNRRAFWIASVGLSREGLQQIHRLRREAPGLTAEDREGAQDPRSRRSGMPRIDRYPSRFRVVARRLVDLDADRPAVSGTSTGLRRSAACPVAPSPRRTGRAWSTSTSSSSISVAGTEQELLARFVVLVDDAAAGAGKLDRARHDGGEDRRQIEGRADRPPDLAERLELLDRLRQLTRPRLELPEEAHVLDGDDALVGERPEQRDLSVGEGLHDSPGHRDGANRLAVSDHRDDENGPVAPERNAATSGSAL